MKKNLEGSKMAADNLVKSIRRKIRHTYLAEEKIRIVWQLFRGEMNISILFRRGGIA